MPFVNALVGAVSCRLSLVGAGEHQSEFYIPFCSSSQYRPPTSCTIRHLQETLDLTDLKFHPEGKINLQNLLIFYVIQTRTHWYINQAPFSITLNIVASDLLHVLNIPTVCSIKHYSYLSIYLQTNFMYCNCLPIKFYNQYQIFYIILDSKCHIYMQIFLQHITVIILPFAHAILKLKKIPQSPNVYILDFTCIQPAHSSYHKNFYNARD